MGKKKRGTGRSPKQLFYERLFRKYMTFPLLTKEELKEYNEIFEEKKKIEVKSRDDELKFFCYDIFVEINNRWNAHQIALSFSKPLPDISYPEREYFYWINHDGKILQQGNV